MADGDAADRLARSFLASREMDERAAYLSRGREYANLSTEDVQRHWASAFRVWADPRTRHEASQLSNDLPAELALRGVQPDLGQVAAEWQAVQDEINRWRNELFDRETVLNDLEEYMKKSGRESN